METETATRYLGFCAICERDIKLHDGKLVHHGYKRPGDGCIHGDCFAVNCPPYEVTAEPLVRLVGHLMQALAQEEDRLEHLLSGKVTHFDETRIVGTWNPTMIKTSYSIYVTEWYMWQSEMNAKISNSKYEIRGIKTEIARLNKWIATWVKKPIRTLEEDVAQKKAAADVRAAEKEEKRAAKAAKEVAKKAKKEALQARREAILSDIVNRAALIPAMSVEEQSKAREQIRKIYHRNRSWIWMSDSFSVEDSNVLVAAGAKRYHNGRADLSSL